MLREANLPPDFVFAVVLRWQEQRKRPSENPKNDKNYLKIGLFCDKDC